MDTAHQWRPYKDVYDVTQQFALNKPSSCHTLKLLLRKYKPDFLSLLKNPARNLEDRTAVKNRNQFPTSTASSIIDDEFIEESLILSDLFELNELVSVDLLHTGQQQKSNYANYTRGLVAVLLYWDGKRNLVSALRTLIQCRKGRSWTLDLPEDASSLATSFTDELLANGITQQILKLLGEIEVEAEMEKLRQQRGLGDSRHRRQIRDLIMEVRQTLAESLFYFAGQSGLPRADVTALIDHLQQHTEVESDGRLSLPSMALLFALLYSIRLPLDTTNDLDAKGIEELKNYPLIADENFIPSIHKVLIEDGNSWKVPGIRACSQLAWSTTLRSISQSSVVGSGMNLCNNDDVLEQDEAVLEQALADRVFLFLKEKVASGSCFHSEEFYVRRVHEMITDLLVNMPLKIKEMRNHGDEVARILMLHVLEGEDPPPELRKDFQHLMELIAIVYDKDPLNLQLSAEFWCSNEHTIMSDGSYIGTRRLSHKQMALFKFIRQSGDILPPLLYIPYLHMLTALATGTQSSRAAFEMLQSNGISLGNGENMISWDHFFSSCHRYLDSLHQDRPLQDRANPFISTIQSSTGIQHQSTPKMFTITPQEVDGLCAVMKLIARIAQYDELACVALYEDHHWCVCGVLFGLLQCPVPVRLKGDILTTLSQLGRIPDVSVGLLRATEQSLIFPKQSQSKSAGGMTAELEEIESRDEDYPLTRGFIKLLAALASLNIDMVGDEYHSYLLFVIESVFIRALSRAYSRPEEKWEIASLCLLLFNKILDQYNPQPEHFLEEKTSVIASESSQGATTKSFHKHPGFTLLRYVYSEGNFFKTVMETISECINYLNSYITKEKTEASLVEASDRAMQLLINALELQDAFLVAMRSSGSALLVTSLDKLLLSMNPTSQKADYIVIIARFIPHNTSHLHLSLHAVRLLSWLCALPAHRKLVTLMTNACTLSVRRTILHGFVEILDSLSSETEDEADLSLVCQSRLAIVRLLIRCLEQPSPNFAHLLLGFEADKPPRYANLQDPGVLGTSRSCLHSLLSILSTDNKQPAAITETPKLAELCYQLVFELTSNSETSEPVSRYLRSSCDFIYKHLQYLPFKTDKVTNTTMMQQSWLLKTTAVELRVISTKQQRSSLQRLVQVLFSQPATIRDSSTFALEQSLYTTMFADTSMSAAASLLSSTMPTSSRTLAVLQMLEIVDLHQIFPAPLSLDQFVPTVVEEGIKSCESTNEHGVVYCDIKMLHRLLESSLNTLGSEDINRKRLAAQDLQNILHTAVERNQIRETIHAKLHFLMSWKQMLEIALSSCPDDLPLQPTRTQVVFAVLQHLVKVVRDEDAAQDLTSPLAAVVLTLVMQIRSTLMSPNTARSFSKDAEPSQEVVNDVTSLQVLISGVIEWLLQSGIDQKARVNLYAVLLHYLQLCQQTKRQTSRSSDFSGLRAAKEDLYSRITRENVRLCKDYGDAFKDLLCKDAFSGHGVCRVLAFGCLDSFVQIDNEQSWLQFMVKHGYLNHIANSFLEEDRFLQEYLNPLSGPVRSVYIYEQKMALLCSLVHSPGGARAVIDSQILNELSKCDFLDMRPTSDYVDDATVFSALSKYRQLVFPVLHLCTALLTAQGPSNHEVCAIVLQFVLSHCHTLITCVLRSNNDDVQSLTELKLVTEILSQTASQDFTDSTLYPDIPQALLMELQGNLLRIQRQLLNILPHFSLPDDLLNILKAKSADAEYYRKIELLIYAIASNILTYCRVCITNSCDADSALLFSPELADSSSGSSIFGNEILRKPSLGLLIKVLQMMLSKHTSETERMKQLKYKLDNIETLGAQDLKEILGPQTDVEQLTVQREQKLAVPKLHDSIATKDKLIQCLYYIMESCLFLLWQHLDRYLSHAILAEKTRDKILFPAKASPRTTPRRLQDISNVFQEASPVLTKQVMRPADVANLKADLATCLNDTFLRRISSLESRGAFVRPLIRRMQYFKLQFS